MCVLGVHQNAILCLWKKPLCHRVHLSIVSLSVSTHYGASWCIVRHTLVLCGQTVNLGVWLDVWDLLLPYLGKCMVWSKAVHSREIFALC